MTQCERREAMEETHLCSQWEIELRVQRALPGGSDNWRRPNVPILCSIPVEAIQDHIYVVEEKRDLCESWHGHDTSGLWRTNDPFGTQSSPYFPSRVTMSSNVAVVRSNMNSNKRILGSINE
jgi:hypothetical protein